MFMDNAKYLDRAGGDARRRLPRPPIISRSRRPPTLTVLRTAQPFRDFVVVSRKLFPDALRPRSLFETEGVAPGAIVHPTAEIEDGVDHRSGRGDRPARRRSARAP